MALRDKFHEAPIHEWPEALARRDLKALEKARQELAEEIKRFLFGQFIVLRHWLILREYANQRGVRLLGDLPIFVSPDSSDVWADPGLFLLDKDLKPTVEAGVPPDYFSAHGQLWGNPVYNWDELRRTGYRWWINRLSARLEYLDAIRIDHFRAFEAGWQVPAGSPTAQSGHWAPGPGGDFFEKVRQALSRLPLLAEDLGLITPAVTSLRDQFQLPGMRVLQFAFNGDPNNPHLPHHYIHNCVAYTGTHDNDTTLGWYNSLPDHERRNFWNYLQRPPGGSDEAVCGLIRLTLSSPAALAITPLQDLLGLDSAARMNVPGKSDNQWRWRSPDDDTSTSAAFNRLHELTEASGRLGRNSWRPDPRTQEEKVR
jgi:4-alpha-glucanotransferase